MALSSLAASTGAADTSLPATPHVAKRAAGKKAQFCTMKGCMSGIEMIAHIPATPAELLADGAFTVCHQGWCMNGTFAPPQAAGSGIYGCSRTTNIGPGPFCYMLAEGAGSVLSLFFHAPGNGTAADKFIDGDRVEMRVKVGGKSVLDHVRRLKYWDNYPNGKLCGPPCRAATVELWPGATTTNKVCPSEKCTPFVRFERTIPMTADAAGTTIVTACRNDDCRTTRITLWDWEDGHGVTRGNEDGTFDDGADHFGPTLEYRSTGKGSCVLAVKFRGDTRLFKSGERYRVDWRVESSGKILMKSDRIVNDYDETHSGGRECTPVACKSKTFRL